jgi:hypothetical protein
MENIPVSSMVSKQLSDVPTTKNQGPQRKSDNQTLIEKFFIVATGNTAWSGA